MLRIFGYGILFIIPFRPFRLPTLRSTVECTLVGSVTIDLFIAFACMSYNKLRFGHWMGWDYFPGGDIKNKLVKEPNIDFSPTKYGTKHRPTLLMLPHPTWITVLTFVKFAVLGSLGTFVLSNLRGRIPCAGSCSCSDSIFLCLFCTRTPRNKNGPS